MSILSGTSRRHADHRQIGRMGDAEVHRRIRRGRFALGASAAAGAEASSVSTDAASVDHIESSGGQPAGRRESAAAARREDHQLASSGIPGRFADVDVVGHEHQVAAVRHRPRSSRTARTRPAIASESRGPPFSAGHGSTRPKASSAVSRSGTRGWTARGRRGSRARGTPRRSAAPARGLPRSGCAGSHSRRAGSPTTPIPAVGGRVPEHRARGRRRAAGPRALRSPRPWVGRGPDAGGEGQHRAREYRRPAHVRERARSCRTAAHGGRDHDLSPERSTDDRSRTSATDR